MTDEQDAELFVVAHRSHIEELVDQTDEREGRDSSEDLDAIDNRTE